MSVLISNDAELDTLLDAQEVEHICSVVPVSYTHLDVYKRQLWTIPVAAAVFVVLAQSCARLAPLRRWLYALSLIHI